MEQVVPGLVKLSETLNSPVIASLPTDLSGFVDSINDLVRRLSPLGQLAESAGGLFGLRIPGLSRGGSTPEPPPPARAHDLEPPKSVKKAPAKKAAAKKSTAKK
jgi:hypothetical protein